MWTYLLERFLVVIPTLFILSLLIFFSIRLIPGDPAEIMAGEYATKEQVQLTRKRLGLDRPLYMQYIEFVSRLMHGDLGRSIRTNSPVFTEIKSRYINTLELTTLSMLLAFFVGGIIGIISALKWNTWIDNVAMVGALIGVSMPVFWLGLLLILVFSVKLPWFPSVGKGSFAHFILPSLTLATLPMAIIARTTRASMLDVIRQNYVTTARAKGLAERAVVLKHALRNASIPIITIAGLQVGILLGGAVITETIFAWPGIGRILVNSVIARDYPMVQGIVLMLAITVILVNLAVDLIYGFLNPRIHYG
ncbi:MAG TPA: ABC transporter permease [Candidatus Acetothermia bacterium]|nr:ABC transporter permease [Candidatus Acetothermia bacterium]